MPGYMDIWEGDQALDETILQAFESSGLIAKMIPRGDGPINPRRYLLEANDIEEEVWVYASLVSSRAWPYKSDPPKTEWIYTPKLRERDLNPAGMTLSLVYDRKYAAFLAVDPRYNMVPSYDTKKGMEYPNLLCPPRSVLEKVASSSEGIAFHVESAGEKRQIYVGMKPHHLGAYMRMAGSLHSGESSYPDYRYEDGDPVFPMYVPCDLRVGLARLFDEATRDNFRVRVADAYGHQCAATRLQLGLFDGAHIYPSKQSNSSHEVTNGIALAPTIHRAMDQGLIYLVMNEDGSYEFRMNHHRVRVAITGGRNGLNDIARWCGKKLKMPKKKSERPDCLQILKGNIVRGVLGFSSSVPDGEELTKKLAQDPAWTSRIARLEQS